MNLCYKELLVPNDIYVQNSLQLADYFISIIFATSDSNVSIVGRLEGRWLICEYPAQVVFKIIAA